MMARRENLATAKQIASAVLGEEIMDEIDDEARHEPVSYPDHAIRKDLARLERTWEQVQQVREGAAIYAYLNVVYELVVRWTNEGRELERARRAVRHRGLNCAEGEHPFASIIRCTT